MEGITLHMEKTIILPPATARTDYFRPYGMKRSQTDLTLSARKRHEKVDFEARQNSRGNHVPVVSVQYDVPKTPPSPLMYRIRKLHTQLSGGQNGRSKGEDRINQVAVNVESQRLKGLGVGKCYSEYHPPPTAPESGQRQGFTPTTPSYSNSRASQRASVMPSPMSQSQSASPSRQTSTAMSSQRPPSQDRAILKNAQAHAIKQITNIYNSRPKTNNKEREVENKAKNQNQKSMVVHHPTYMHSPMLFSQSHHPGNHEVRSVVHLNGEGQTHQYRGEGQGHQYRDEGQGQQYRIGSQTHQNRGEGQGQQIKSANQCHQKRGEGHEDVDKIYAAFQNVKNEYGSYLNEYNKRLQKAYNLRGHHETAQWRIEKHAAKDKNKKKLRLLMEVTRKLPKDEKDIERAAKSEVSQFTLRDLLLQKARSESQRNELKLPKLNVVEFTEDKDGGNGPHGSSTSNTALLNMNQRLNQMKAQKELTSVQMYSQRMVRLRMSQNQRRQILPWFGSTVVVPQGLGFYRVRWPTYTDGFNPKSSVVPMEQEYLSLSSSSTPTVPYSTADILYGSEVNGSRGQQTDDGRQNSFSELEKSRDLARSRSKELEQNPNNKRPSSRSAKQKSLTIDSVTPFDKDRDDSMRSLSSALPPAKPSHHFRPNGIRSSIVKSDQLYSSKTNGRDQDDLVAMGTLWSPNSNNPGQPPPPLASSSSQQQQQQQASSRNNSVSNSNTNSFPSKVVSSSSSVNQSNSLSNNTLNSQRKYPGNSIRPIVVQNNVSGRKNSNSMKEQEEPKYSDPMFGAPASFQQRIIELGALEGDTVRWERSKRLKKKKQDRDS